jgi:hypothetical protein
VIGRLRALIRGLSNPEAIRYTHDGNRSVVRLDYRALLQDRRLARMATEYRATGNFTGHLMELEPEDAAFVEEIRKSLALMRDRQKETGYRAGPMWAEHNLRMIENGLKADPRLYNHAGALGYKSFSPRSCSLELALSQVLRTLLCYEHLSPAGTDFTGLFTGLNSPYFTVEGQRLNEGIRAHEEKRAVQPLLDLLETRKSGLRVIEIGAGNGQLPNLFLREGAKVVIVDIPGMHAQAPFLLHRHSGKRICTYHRFIERGGDVDRVLSEYDLLTLPPWEIGRIRARFDLAVNVHSLGEMSPEEVAQYLRMIDSQCDSFFSVNTNLRGLDAGKQPEYKENSALSFGQQLGMKLCKTGTLLFNTSFHQTVHYGYALFSRVFAPSEFSEKRVSQPAGIEDLVQR